MLQKTIISFLSGVLVCLGALSSHATMTSLYQTVEQALNSSPRLQMLEFNREAVKHEMQQSRGEYLPSVDMILGYGTDQHSDRSTRSSGVDPSDSDWDARGEASLALTQMLYDGGKVKSRVAAREALLSSAEHRFHDNAQSIALDAIISHLQVYRQRELVALSEKNLKIHQDILDSLEQLRQAGAGSIADVTQVQGRLARAESSLYSAKADLVGAEANYLRVVGVAPVKVGFAGIPVDAPTQLAQALTETEAGNPKVLALGSDLEEANARVSLAKSAYAPKVNLELKSNYNDQVEGDASWQHSNEAMLRMRWNLFNGGQDKSGVGAAESRKLQSRSNRGEQLVDVLEATSATWALYQSANKQVESYRQAVGFNEQTLDSYLKQFNVSQRSLLDVLDAENEYFQSGGLLLTSAVNETIASYRLLALSGRLRVSESSGLPGDEPDYLKALRADIGLQKPTPFNGVPVRSAPMPVAAPAPKVTALPAEMSIQILLDSWVEAWKTQDVDAYLGFYSRKYVPELGRSMAAWEAFRRKRLAQPENIQLHLESIKIKAMEAGNYLASFKQVYQSNLYQDTVEKSLELEPGGGNWRILREVATPPNN